MKDMNGVTLKVGDIVECYKPDGRTYLEQVIHTGNHAVRVQAYGREYKYLLSICEPKQIRKLEVEELI